jgi:hypothetical protein
MPPAFERIVIDSLGRVLEKALLFKENAYLATLKNNTNKRM